MSKPIVEIWLKGVNLIQENTLTFSAAIVKHDVSPYSLVYQHEKCVVKP